MVDALTRLPPSAVPVMFTVWPGLTWFEETRCCRTTAVLDVTRMVCFFPPRSFTIQVSLLIETTSPMTAEVSAPSPDAPGPPLQAWGSRRPERHRLPPGCQRPTGSPRTSDLPSSRDPGRRACLRRRGAEVPLHLGAGQEDECRCEKTRQHEAATRAPVGLGHPLLVETILIGSRSVSGEATWFGLAGRCFGRTWVGHVHLVLLVAKGVDGSQRRGPVGGVQTEEQADEDGDSEGEEHRVRRHDRFDADDGELRPDQSDDHANHPAEKGEQDRLGQELTHDLAFPGADCLADTDLARSLGHRDQHDVHDPDSTHQQRANRSPRWWCSRTTSPAGGKGEEPWAT